MRSIAVELVSDLLPALLTLGLPFIAHLIIR